MLYGTISEYCTKSGCPLMAAGDCRYLWADKKITKPIEVSAPEYVELLMSWVESQLNDEAIFPIKFDSSYPKKFHAICATIYKRFFRVYAHIYHAHFKQIQTLGADAHLNTWSAGGALGTWGTCSALCRCSLLVSIPCLPAHVIPSVPFLLALCCARVSSFKHFM